MARPKKLSFPCTYCGKTFKREAFLTKHLLSHSSVSGQSRRGRIRTNWCHVCRQRFSESEYKLHIKTEHQYDSCRMYTDDSDSENEDIKQNINLTDIDEYDFCPNEDKYTSSKKNIKRETNKTIVAKSPRKKVLNISKTLQVTPAYSPIIIKTELSDVPLDTCESKTSPQKRKKLDARKFIFCSKCGIKCKGQRGLNIHMRTHKRKSHECKSSPKMVKTRSIHQLKQEKADISSVQCKNSVTSSSNNQPLFVQSTAPNLSHNAQAGLIYNMFPIQNQSLNNIIGIGNQPNLQIVPVLASQNPPVETIPKFDHDSENYIKWLKKFINRCKMHKYPLTPMLCQSISHINEEITDALADPVGSLRKRSNHFYFMKIKSILSEIMLGHMRYSLNVVKR